MFAGEDSPTIRLQFAGEGRQTSKKIGTVMGAFSVLREQDHTLSYQYTTCLYNGIVYLEVTTCETSMIFVFFCSVFLVLLFSVLKMNSSDQCT